jgi:hypothetical protein
MQAAADFHDTIANARLSEAAGVVDDAAALDTAIDVFDAHAAARDAPVGRLLRLCEFLSSWLPGRHDDLHLGKRERQAAQILEPAAARGQGLRGRIGNPLIVCAARIGLTEREDRERRVDQQYVFHRVVFFLAAITARLLSRILGALDAPFGAIVATRGEASAGAGAALGGSASVGDTTTAAALASATPMRWASSANDRLGASPSAHSVACSTTNRT